MLLSRHRRSSTNLVFDIPGKIWYILDVVEGTWQIPLPVFIPFSLYRAFWGLGVGTALLEDILNTAGTVGYEQAELDVVSTNAPAVALYQKLGFETTGTIPRAFKYKDGTYADFLFMVKGLT